MYEKYRSRFVSGHPTSFVETKMRARETQILASVWKISGDGSRVIWHRQPGLEGEAIDLFANGDVAVSGYGYPWYNEPYIPTPVCRFSSGGELMWKTDLGEVYGYRPGRGINSIKVDPFGDVVAVGYCLDSPVETERYDVTKLDGITGEILWQRLTDNTTFWQVQPSANGVDIDGSGNIYVTGTARSQDPPPHTDCWKFSSAGVKLDTGVGSTSSFDLCLSESESDILFRSSELFGPRLYRCTRSPLEIVFTGPDLGIGNMYDLIERDGRVVVARSSQFVSTVAPEILDTNGNPVAAPAILPGWYGAVAFAGGLNFAYCGSREYGPEGEEFSYGVFGICDYKGADVWEVRFHKRIGYGIWGIVVDVNDPDQPIYLCGYLSNEIELREDPGV